MRGNDSAITIIALALGVCLTLTLVFGNFSLAYLVQLFAEGRVPLDSTLFVFAVTLANMAVLGFLGRHWLKTIRKARLENLEPTSQPTQRQNNQQRWEAAKEQVLGLAQRQASFDIQEVMHVTDFNRAESEYLLDELLARDVLHVTQDADEFKYSLKSLAELKPLTEVS